MSDDTPKEPTETPDADSSPNDSELKTVPDGASAPETASEPEIKSNPEQDQPEPDKTEPEPELEAKKEEPDPDKPEPQVTNPDAEVPTATTQVAETASPTQRSASTSRTGTVRSKPPPEIKFLPREKHYVTSPEEEYEILMSEEGVGANEPITILQMFHAIVKQYPSQIALKERVEDVNVALTYKQYWDQCWQAAKAMRKLGLDVLRAICVIGFNSSEWLIACIASMMAGGMCAGVYTTNSPEACQFVAENCKAQLFFVEDTVQLRKVLSIRSALPELKAIIQYKGELSDSEPNVLTWAQFMELGKRDEPTPASPTDTTEDPATKPDSSDTATANDEPKSKTKGLDLDESGFDDNDKSLKEIVASITPNRCCLIIYTSGTTGNPKGVMLCHDNMTFTVHGLKKFFPHFITASEHTISYLPLSHIAAQIADIYLPISVAATVNFARRDALKGTLGETLREVRPTYFFGVPRVWEKFEERMKGELAKASGIKLKIANWSMNKGLTGNMNRQNNKSVPFGWFIADKLMFKKIRALVGLDRCRLQITGAAPIATSTLEFFMSIDISLYELYGMSESTGVQVANVPKLATWKSGSVGKPYDGIEMKIVNPDKDGNGEILTRGRHVFMGYLGADEKTINTIDKDGYLHSEDVGKVDADGFFYVTGRIKEILITAGGENIPPVPLENEIKAEMSFISSVMVIGNRRRFLAALITLQLVMDETSGMPTDQLSPLAKQAFSEIGCNVETVTDVLDQSKDFYSIVLKAMQEGIDRANDRAISHAQKVRQDYYPSNSELEKEWKIQKWTLLDTDFSISGGELGPTMKLKRNFVEEKYKKTIESFYEDTSPPTAATSEK